MRNFHCLLIVLKRSFIFYYIICLTVPLMSKTSERKYEKAYINDNRTINENQITKTNWNAKQKIKSSGAKIQHSLWATR